MFSQDSVAWFSSQSDYVPVTMQNRRNAFKSTATRASRGTRVSGSAARSKRFGAFRKTRRGKARRSLPQPLRPYDYALNVAPPRSNFYRRVVTIRDAQSIAGGGAAYGATSVFSLTGAIPASGYVSNMNNNGTTGITELASLQNLFALYKITKVVVTFRSKLTEFSDATQALELMYRYNYDANRQVNSGGGSAQFDSSTNVKVHRFSNESPFVTATIYPKIQAPTYAYTGVTADGYALGAVDSPWIDLSTDSEHGGGASVPYYGLDFYFPYMAVGTQVGIDVELTIDFKYQH